MVRARISCLRDRKSFKGSFDLYKGSQKLTLKIGTTGVDYFKEI